LGISDDDTSDRYSVTNTANNSDDEPLEIVARKQPAQTKNYNKQSEVDEIREEVLEMMKRVSEFTNNALAKLSDVGGTMGGSSRLVGGLGVAKREMKK
jgi:hypothetical protein